MVSLSNQDLEKIIDLARLAPSVHNTQPWKISLGSSGIRICINKKFQLKEGDPTGRQTVISLGILCEAIQISAKSLGFETETLIFRDYEANIKLLNNSEFNTRELEELKYLKKRCTDRSIYKPCEIPKGLEEDLQKIKSDKMKIWVVKDPDLIKKISALTGKGIRLALTSPGFRKELSKYLVHPWSNRKRGISTSSLYIPLLIAALEPLLLRLGLRLGAEEILERKRWLSSSAMIITSSPGDLPNDWFNSGRLYLKISLLAEKYGLSQATSAAIIEASNFHEDIEKQLGTNQRLQTLIRVGRGAKRRRYSPRVSARDLIFT